MLCPIANQPEVNAHLESLGYGPTNFSARVTNIHNGKIKYFLCNWLIDEAEFGTFEVFLRSKGVLIFTDAVAKQVMEDHSVRKSFPEDLDN
jgi:hypothetical protein